MNDIEKAIQLVKNKKWTVSMCLTSSECAEHNGLIDLAIQALKEKAEREKGCKICNNEYDTEISSCITYRHTSSYATTTPIDINCCPNCGRKLVDK